MFLMVSWDLTMIWPRSVLEMENSSLLLLLHEGRAGAEGVGERWDGEGEGRGEGKVRGGKRVRGGVAVAQLQSD